MKRSDRAALVIAELESRGMAGEEVTSDMIVDAIQRNALGDHELEALHREVVRALYTKGYDVQAPINPLPWALFGAGGLVLWVLLVLGVLHLTGVL